MFYESSQTKDNNERQNNPLVPGDIKKESLKFFTQKIDEMNSIYNFTEKEKSELRQNLFKARNSSTADELWFKIWRKYAKENRVSLAVRYALKKCHGKGDKIAKLSSAEYELSQELKKSLKVADKYFAVDEAKPFKEQVQRLDESLLTYFKQQSSGHQTKAIIKALTANHSSDLDYNKRVAKWQDPLYIPQLIARCQWSDNIRALVWEMEKKAPALASPIHQQLLRAQNRGNRLNEEGDSIIDGNGKKVIDFDSTACIELETAKSVLLSAIPLLSSVTAYYVITWLLREVHRQFLMGYKNPRQIVLEGMAYERLGELSGAGTHPSTIDKIRKIIPALAGCLFKYRTKDRIGEGNFLSYCYERAINGTYSILIIEMQPLACPGFILTLPKGGMKFQEQRKAIPVTRPFPFYGKQSNSFSLQLRFQYALVQEMRNRARELHQCGGISLDAKDISDLALEAQLPEKTIESIIDFWVKEDCLAQSKDGLYNLGRRESAARRMIEEAGKYEVEGTHAAKKNLVKQRKKLIGNAKW